MARGTTLANALLMFKGEVGASLVTSTGIGSDNEFYSIIDNQQKWLAVRYDWPFLATEGNIPVAAGTGDAVRYQTVPSNFNFERPVTLDALWNQRWVPVEFGIGPREYNTHSSGDTGMVSAEQADPISKWRFKPGDESLFEIWPLPATSQRLRFTGQRNLTPLATDGVYNVAATLDLDDLLVVLFGAAKYLRRRKSEDAPMVLAQAEGRLADLRAAYPSTPDGSLFGVSQKAPGYSKPRLV